jgi:hypothetical protein
VTVVIAHFITIYVSHSTLLIVPNKNERDSPLFTGKLLIKFQNILRNTTQVIIQHRVKNPIFRHISSLPVKRGESLSFLVGTISNILVMEIGGQMWGVGGIS